MVNLAVNVLRMTSNLVGIVLSLIVLLDEFMDVTLKGTSFFMIQQYSNTFQMLLHTCNVFKCYMQHKRKNVFCYRGITSKILIHRKKKQKFVIWH